MIVEAEDDPCFVCTKCGGQKAADHHWIGVWERECGKYLRKPGVKILRRLLVWSESSARVAAGSIRKSRSESAVKIAGRGGQPFRRVWEEVLLQIKREKG